MRRLSSVSGLALALAGCTARLGYGDEPELAVDAGPERPDAAGGSSSGPSPTEAGPAPSLCDRATHTFCTTFDGADYLAGWYADEPAHVVIGRDATQFVSPPASARFEATQSGSDTVYGMLGVGFGEWADRPFVADFAFALRIESATPATFTVIGTPLLVGPGNAAPTSQLQLSAHAHADGRSAGLTVNEIDQPQGGGPTRGLDTTAVVPLGSWVHLRLHVVRSAAERSVRLDVDDQVVLSAPLEYLELAGEPSTAMGVATLDGQPCTWVFQLDDLTIDFR
jgi:hypothetical protein